MKNFLGILILFFVIMLNCSITVNAHSIELDFYQMFEEHGSVMTLVDADTGEIEHASMADADFYGYSVNELEAMNMQELTILTIEDLEKISKETLGTGSINFVLDQILANGELRKADSIATIYDITAKFLTEQRNKNMEILVVSILSSAIIILGLFSFLLFRNLKKLKNQNNQIENFNELRKTFIDADNSLIYLKDENLKYIFVNKALEDFYNKKASEIIGKDAYELAEQDFADLSRKTDLEALEKNANIINVVKWKNIIYQKTKFPVKLVNGKYGVGAYIKDITEEHNIKTNLDVTMNALLESEEKLQIILNSSAEAIYGIDLEGRCTFCNISCIRMLGYNNQEDLLGKNMHWQIHHSRKDGTPLPIKECKIFQSFIKGEGMHADDEVFWRSNGTSFEVEYNSYPQIRNEEIIGSVVTFMDISDRKRKEAEIEFLSFHDQLTGLNNRRNFEMYREELDNLNNLPLSVIFADINGLKLTNDIFGHSVGDELIKKSAKILKKACRENDIIARVGGDEFIILLPKTSKDNAEKLIARIKSGFLDASIEAIKCSISLGLETKNNIDQTLEQIITTAENKMYKDKTMNRNANNKSILDTMVNTLHSRYPREKQHSINVAKLCTEIGIALNLPETDISTLNRVGYLHDIGKIVLDEEILLNDYLNDEEQEEMQQHSVVGYRILNLFDETLDLAEYVFSHHERWDGTGYPRGLKGDQIPLISRILSVVETYDRILNRGEQSLEERKSIAIDAIIKRSGTRFDPKICEFFISLK